jgi:hypothetical protein
MISGRASHKGSSTKPNLNTNGIVNADPDNLIASPDSPNNSGNRVPLRQKGTDFTLNVGLKALGFTDEMKSRPV